MFMKYHSLLSQPLPNRAYKISISGISRYCFFIALFAVFTFNAKGQQQPDTSKLLSSVKDTTNNGAPTLSIRQCVAYAMIHQPALNQAQINIEITRATNAIDLSTWLP